MAEKLHPIAIKLSTKKRLEDINQGRFKWDGIVQFLITFYEKNNKKD